MKPSTFLARLLTPFSMRIVSETFPGRGHADWYVFYVFGIRVAFFQAWGLK